MLEHDETTLRDGYCLRQVGDRYEVVNEGGAAVGKPIRSQSLALKRLFEYRSNHIARQKQLADQNSEPADASPIPHHTETDLIDGYRMKQIGTQWAIFNAAGMAISENYRSPLMLTSKLMFARECYRDGYRARSRETDALVKEMSAA
ncbi:MAG: hypothetical protein AAF085_12505 [Planctomycetota bacterium]